MKGKDIQNQREEISDLEQRLQTKVAESKALRTQLQILQSKYEECLNELQNNESG